MPTSQTTARAGLIYGLAAYLLWGGLPIYFLLLSPTGPVELVAWRIVFSLVLCVILITVTRGWRSMALLVRRPRAILTLGLAAVLIFVNWQVYVYATLSGHVIEASLGYFMNPIVTVLLGVIVLRERLRPLQWAAIGVCAVAVIVLAIVYGGLPWIAIVLALSFGLYGLVKKKVGTTVDALGGLAVETAWLLPLAIVMLSLVSATSLFGTAGLAFAAHGAGLTLLLVGVGVVTAVPLILFAAASRRLSLVSIGLIQFLTPIIQFLLGYFVLHEAMPPARWFGFGLVWVAVVVLCVDLLRQGRATRRAAPLPA